MCGLAGILVTGDRPPPDPEVVRRMRAAIDHRGPDERGEYFDAHIHLAAARLAIRDLAGGHQPARGCRPTTIAVYNGELYNTRELRAELEPEHALSDQSDTTLLPHLYEVHREHMVEKLRGMFAFAIWDASEQTLFLARDRFGIKPLYYVETGGYFLFASEQKALFASGLVEARIDRAAIADLFAQTYPLAPRTMFAGIRELQPGHTLAISPRERRHARYWRLPFPKIGAHHRGARKALEHELAERLGETVRDHLVSDVPVAAYLSGGIDSATVAALAAQAGPAPATFSISVKDPRLDERAEAAAIAKAIGADHHVIDMDASSAARYPELVRTMELPLHVPGAIGALLLAERAREAGFPVVLTGDGADELFGGYDCFKADKLRRLLDRPGLRSLTPWIYRRAKLPKGAAEFLVETQKRSPADLENAFRGVRPAWYETWQIFSDREKLLGRETRPATDPPEGYDAFAREDFAELHPLDAALALEAETRLPSWILIISDRPSMAKGVEVRVPFLDHHLAEWIAALPPEMKLRGFTEKSALRGAMRSILPREVVRRPKRPFMIPVGDWFLAKGRPEYVGEYLGPAQLEKAGIFDPKTVADLEARFHAAPADHLERVRLELTLMLVLGVQLLASSF